MMDDQRNVPRESIERMGTRLGSLLACLAACGGTSAAPDAPPVPPDVGTQCSVEPAEGGQVFVEYITYDSELQASLALPSGVTTQSRVTAFFLADETPEDNPLPNAGQCTNLVATKSWPMNIGTPRTELDLGTLTITGMSGTGATTITPPKLGAGTDDFGRAQDIYYQQVDPNASNHLLPDSTYTVSFPGNGTTVPAATFTDNLGLANTFGVMSPDLENNGPLVAGTDFPVSWTPVVSTTIPPTTTIVGVTWLLDIRGAPTHMCTTLDANGTFTIPGTAITEFKQIAQARGVATNKLILRRDAVIDKLVILPGDTNPCTQRRIDLLGLTSVAQLMNVN